MSYKIIALMLLTASIPASAGIKQSHSKIKCDLDIYLKELNCPKTKPIIAATTMSFGTYLLYDAIKTTADLKEIEQKNSEKAIALNAIIAAGLITASLYLAMNIWQEHNAENKESQTSNR